MFFCQKYANLQGFSDALMPGIRKRVVWVNQECACIVVYESAGGTSDVDAIAAIYKGSHRVASPVYNMYGYIRWMIAHDYAQWEECVA